MVIDVRDVTAGWRWVPQHSRWERGTCWVRPLRHDMLQRLHLTDGRRTLFVVRKRRQPAEPDQTHGHLLSTEAFDREWVDLSDWPGEFQAVRIDQDQRLARFTTGVWNTVPLYLAFGEGRVQGSWDPVDLYLGRDLTGLDLLTVSRTLTYRHRYGHRTLYRDVYRLTERASVNADLQGLRVVYPGGLGTAGRGRCGMRPIRCRHSCDSWRTPSPATPLMGNTAWWSCPVDGMVGAQQRARRALMVEHLGLGPDLTVPAWQHAPFCLDGGRRETRAAFDPGGEPYLEATEAMLAAMAEAGAQTVWCGVGGDELMALRPEERGHDLDGDAREFAAWITPDTVEMLLASRDDVAPASVINEVTLMAMACAAPRYLRAGLWTMVPLAHPDLIRFCEWLPQRWRRDKTLMRRYLAGCGLPEVVVHPPLHENLAGVMQIGLRQFGIPLLRRWMKDLILADLRLIDPDALRGEVDAVEASAMIDQRLYPLIALEAGLRSLTRHA